MLDVCGSTASDREQYITVTRRSGRTICAFSHDCNAFAIGVRVIIEKTSIHSAINAVLSRGSTETQYDWLEATRLCGVLHDPQQEAGTASLLEVDCSSAP